tara:strand:+ start:9319 stop:9966 length:648 start_codon:yes stop_codon:yes gene_type:complete
MAKKHKSIVEALEDLDSTPVDAEEICEDVDENDPKFRANSLTPDEKKAQAFQWSMAGHPVSGIAKIFDVSEKTIRRWFHDVYAEFRTEMEQRSGADNIAEQLVWLSELERVCLYEIHNSQNDDTSIDPATGVVTQNQNPRSQSERVKWLQAALSARKLKIDILQKANVLPVEPDRIYHKMQDEMPKTEKEDPGKTKTREEIEDAIEKLIKKGLSL